MKKNVGILLLKDYMKFRDYCTVFYVHQTYEKFRSPTCQQSENTPKRIQHSIHVTFIQRQRESEQYAFACITLQNFVESQPAKNYTVHECVNSLTTVSKQSLNPLTLS